MRPVYFILKYVLKFALWVYYPRVRLVNQPKKRFARTIYASNHAASFMDPLVVASNQKPIVFFMTRSDVFTPLLKPLLWAAHMLPIYRSHDGEDTKTKNEIIFQQCYRILKYGRSLLIFAEGFTDDVFIRSLKPIKKGAVRIGFGALEELNWSKNIYIQAVGINYADPNQLGSDVVIANGHPICLNSFKEEYLENPTKVVHDVSKLVESEMQQQLTYIENKQWAPVHEKIMMLTRKGMNAKCSDKSIPLIERWTYSRELANWMNARNLDEDSDMLALRQTLEGYFDVCQKVGVDESDIYDLKANHFRPVQELLYFICLSPLVMIGLVHNYIVYSFVKRFTEKSFKRKVFWGSVKMFLGTVLNGLYNILLVVIANFLLYRNPLFWTAYFFIVPMLSGIIAYTYFKRWSRYKRLRAMQKRNLSKIYEMRQLCLDKIQSVIPIA
jgi:1-acyl-sn-glycerol-3-phosphate acyltransferase